MILYADTSSLLKLYLQERESPLVVSLVASSETLATSVVSYSELRAGLARALRDGRVDHAQHDRYASELNRDWRYRIQTLEVTRTLAFRAGDLAHSYALRGFDAIHLASALTLQEGLGEQVTFSAFDDRLVDAAVACGLARP